MCKKPRQNQFWFSLCCFFNVFLAKTNPHALPSAISLFAISLSLSLLPSLCLFFCLCACANVRFASGIVSFFFAFAFCCFVVDFLPPAPRLNGCLPRLSPAPQLCPVPSSFHPVALSLPTLYASEPWDFISCKKVEVLGRFLLSPSRSFCLFLSLSLCLCCLLAGVLHTHSQLMRIGNKERPGQARLVNYKFRSVSVHFIFCKTSQKSLSVFT